MPPHLPPRTTVPPASPYGPAYPPRAPFPRSPAGAPFGRTQAAVSFGPRENAGFGSWPPYDASAGQNVGFPGQRFRPNPGENFGHIPSQPATHTARQELPLPLGGSSSADPPRFNSPRMEASRSYGPPPNSYSQPKPLQQKQGANKPGAPQPQQQQPPEDIAGSGNTDAKAVTPKTPTGQESAPSKNVENLNTHHANGAQAKPRGGQMRPREPLYPCGICTREVNDDQDAILCEASCQKWFHRICTGMTESAYGLLTAEASAVWGCDACMADRDVQLMRPGETAGPPLSDADA